MNRTKIKNYAPQARRDFLQAVKDRAAFYGLTANGIEPVTVQGDVAIIGGKAFPREIGAKRKALQERVERDGYGPTMEALAYTWFNRLVAIRYMELHGYLDHGYRILSPRDLTTDRTDSTDKNPDLKLKLNLSVKSVPSVVDLPEILLHAEHVELPDLNRERVVELKLDGSKEAELYRMLLVAQCNALHSAMPFLFERIGDETELVLPESLLHSDSIVRKLVSGIDEEDWQEVEVIGWLYEAYVSERYEAVIGSVVASADIPAATQRFTPKWIVRYLVQNTLGRQWMATYPQSPLAGQMKYYIEPAEQTPEVQEQLRAITPTSLNPEEITFLDPACGSAHILVEAYDLFKAIYQERGYRAKDIPRLILTKNLFGLEIDDRAAQLAAFALMMKARADDRRIFDQGIQPHVRALLQTDGMDAEDMAAALNVTAIRESPSSGQLFETEDNLFTRAATSATASQAIDTSDVTVLINLFEHAKTFGSLIQVPPALAARLPLIEQTCREVAGQSGEIASRTAARLLPVIEQARMLAGRYDCVVANPPYMGSKFCNSPLKEYLNTAYKPGKGDLYSAFVIRNISACKQDRFIGMITIPNWMAHPTFSDFRETMYSSSTVDTFVHNGRGVWGSDFGSCSFTLRKTILPEYRALFKRLFVEEGSVATLGELEQRFFNNSPYHSSLEELEHIPGKPLAYWVGSQLRNAFRVFPKIKDTASTGSGLQTSDNPRFLRQWFEVSWNRIGLGCKTREEATHSHKKWFPHKKGGEYRKWYGNSDFVVNWENDGAELFAFASKLYGSPTRIIKNLHRYFQPGVTWSHTSIARFSARQMEPGFIFNVEGPSLFSNDPDLFLAYMCSAPCFEFMKVMNPTLHFLAGSVALLPYCDLSKGSDGERARQIAQEAVRISKQDWNGFESSWDFEKPPVFQNQAITFQQSLAAFNDECLNSLARLKKLEQENNRLFIDAYGLRDELSPEVPDDQITLYRPNREEDIRRLISYAVGCTMGRYSLDTPGLIYAHGGNVGFDPGQYRTFPADPDGIVPVMEADWFADDAANRFVEFLGICWPGEKTATEGHGRNTEKESKELSSSVSLPCPSVANSEDLKFVADALGPNKGEQPRDTIRRYLATGFFKHHLQTYKRRPIYWLFSSGKQRAFQCLVYLHRYHDGTLARMRTEYVIPLQGKLTSRIDQLAGDIPKATSTSHRTTLTKERDKLIKQQAELQAYDEKLRHFADMRIALDLDDGVKVNYGKFGDLLAEVKAVTGGKDEE